MSSIYPEFGFNKNDLFYPHSVQDFLQSHVRNHRIYPVLLSLHHEVGAYVWDVDRPNGSLTDFRLCDALGMPIGFLQSTSDTNSLYIYDAADRPSWSESLIGSDNPRYILTRIRKLMKDHSSKMSSLKVQGGGVILDAMRHLFINYLYALPEDLRQAHSPSFLQQTDTELLEIYRGRKSLSELSAVAIENLDRQVQQAERAEQGFASLRRDLIENLSGNKFIFRYNRHADDTSSFTMGGIRMTGIEECIDEYYNRRSAYISDTKSPMITYTFPFRMYRNLDSLPSYKIKDQIMATLSLGRLNRTTEHRMDMRTMNQLLPSCDVNRDFAMLNGGTSFCWARGTGNYDTWFMIADMREDVA